MARRNRVVDTAILIDALRGLAAARDFIRELGDVPICSEVTRVEVLRGMRSGERQRTEALLQEVQWVVVDEPVARRAGELGRRWRASHPGIGAPDLIVAATAEHLGIGLATTNVRHFPMFGDLEPPYES